jgi:hypothetical protein
MLSEILTFNKQKQQRKKQQMTLYMLVDNNCGSNLSRDNDVYFENFNEFQNNGNKGTYVFRCKYYDKEVLRKAILIDFASNYLSFNTLMLSMLLLNH